MTLSDMLGYASIAVTMAVSCYALWRIWQGTHKPHAFSVLIWVIISAIAFFNMLDQGAGIAAWRTGILALMLMTNFVLCCRYGLGYVTRADWLFLVAALAAIPVWIASGNPDIALLWLLAVEMAGNMPMVRKSWVMPHDLSAMIFFFVAVGQGLQCLSIWTSPQDLGLALLVYVVYFPVQFFVLSAIVFYRRGVVPE